MKLYLQTGYELAFLSLCCALFTVRQSDSTFVPGRCLCPQTLPHVKGQLKELTVHPKSPSCDEVTVIVTLKGNSDPVCLNPAARMGKQLIRCWNRAQKLGNVEQCLKRGRGGRRGQRQRPPTEEPAPTQENVILYLPVVNQSDKHLEATS